MEVHRPAADQQAAPATAEPAPVANLQLTNNRPVAPQAPECARVPAPLAPRSPTGEPTLEWCNARHLWRPRACGECPPRLVQQETNRAIAGAAPEVGPAPEPL